MTDKECKVSRDQPLLRFGQGEYTRDVFAVDIDRWWATIVWLLSPPGAGRALRRAACSLFNQENTMIAIRWGCALVGSLRVMARAGRALRRAACSLFNQENTMIAIRWGCALVGSLRVMARAGRALRRAARSLFQKRTHHED